MPRPLPSCVTLQWPRTLFVSVDASQRLEGLFKVHIPGPGAATGLVAYIEKHEVTLKWISGRLDFIPGRSGREFNLLKVLLRFLGRLLERLVLCELEVSRGTGVEETGVWMDRDQGRAHLRDEGVPLELHFRRCCEVEVVERK